MCFVQWIIGLKVPVSNLFVIAHRKCPYLTYISEMGVLRNHTCLCDNPRLCEQQKKKSQNQKHFSTFILILGGLQCWFQHLQGYFWWNEIIVLNWRHILMAHNFILRAHGQDVPQLSFCREDKQWHWVGLNIENDTSAVKISTEFCMWSWKTSR